MRGSWPAAALVHVFTGLGVVCALLALYSLLDRQWERAFAWLGVAAVLGGLLAVFIGLRNRLEKSAVMGSCAFLAGLMIAGAASVFPVMLHSTLAPENSLTAYEGAATGHGLAIALVWWPVALLLSIVYSLFIHRHYAGKVRPAEDTRSPY